MVLVNGTPQDSLPADDRALHYGDGLFETLAVIQGRPRLWSRHYTRLCEGCRRLKLPVPDEMLLLQEIAACAGAESRCVVKLILSRGSGGRGYRMPPEPSTRRILSRHPWPTSSGEEGLRVRLCDTRLACNPLLAGIKHLNRLEQVLARSEWADEFDEGLMRDLDGHLIEGVMSNLLMVHEGRLLSPDLSRCGVHGTMRAEVLAVAAEQGIEAIEQNLGLEQLRQADELLLCNSLLGLRPVTLVDLGAGESWQGSVGPLYRRLSEALNVRLEHPDA